MKALAAVARTREVSVVEHPEPQASSPASVFVRTLEVGVCGTDGELCAFHFGFPPPGEPYLVLGHEALGIVEAVGSGVEGLNEGDLVVPTVRRPCRHDECAACRSGNQDFCVTGDYTERGIFGAHGFLAERFVEEARYLHPVPQRLREVAILAEPLSVVEKGLRQFLSIQRRLPWLRQEEDEGLLNGIRAVVLGAGPVGMLAALLLRLRGARVAVYSREDPESFRAGLVDAIGATYHCSGELSVRALAEEVGGIELVFEAAGAPELSLCTIEAMGPNGAFILTGATGGGGRLDFGADAFLNGMVGRNLVIAGTVNASHADFVAAVSDLDALESRWPEVLPALVTGRHPMDEFPLRALNRTGIKEIVDVSAGL